MKGAPGEMKDPNSNFRRAVSMKVRTVDRKGNSNFVGFKLQESRRVEVCERKKLMSVIN